MEKQVPHPFTKNQNWAYFRINNLNLFLLYTRVEVYQNILELRCLRCYIVRHSTKVLYFIIWPNFIAWLPLPLEIFGNIFILVICCPVCEVINFVINFSFVIKPLFCITKKSKQKCKYLKSGKSFWLETKSIFHYFKRTFNRQKLSQTVIGPLKKQVFIYFKCKFSYVYVILFLCTFCFTVVRSLAEPDGYWTSLLRFSFNHLFNKFDICLCIEQRGDSYWFRALSNENVDLTKTSQ